MITYFIKIFLFFSLVILLQSCGTHIQILQTSNKTATLKKGTLIYPADSTSLGTLAPIPLKSDLKTRILFRDSNKSNLSDALIFIENPNDINYTNETSKKIIQNGTPFFLLPRTKYGKTIDFNAKTKIKTVSKDIGILFNPYQLFFTLKKPTYVEANFANRIKIGVTYTWNFTTHKYSELNYTKHTFGLGPYFMLGTTSISNVSLDKNTDTGDTFIFKNQPVFGISAGGIINYQFSDFFGTALLLGHERIFWSNASNWTFNNNNYSLGLVFTFKFSRI